MSYKVKYLISGECCSHFTATVRKYFVECTTEVDLFPAGYTSKLQPMDVGLNRRFKGYVSDNSSCTNFRIVNRNKKQTKQDVAVWSSSGWNQMSEQIELNSYCGSGYIKESVICDFSSDWGSTFDHLC
jgi:DDE superfamily endonuclease